MYNIFAFFVSPRYFCEGDGGWHSECFWMILKILHKQIILNYTVDILLFIVVYIFFKAVNNIYIYNNFVTLTFKKTRAKTPENMSDLSFAIFYFICDNGDEWWCVCMFYIYAQNKYYVRFIFAQVYLQVTMMIATVSIEKETVFSSVRCFNLFFKTHLPRIGKCII